MHLYLGGAQRAVQKETVLHGVLSVPGMFCAILARLRNFAVAKRSRETRHLDFCFVPTLSGSSDA